MRGSSELGLGSRVGNSPGWLGSTTEGRRPQVRGLCSGGSLALPARPQPPTICHPSWPNLEPGQNWSFLIDCTSWFIGGGAASMRISVLIEPVPGNGYRARGGEPLGLIAEGATRDKALQKLRELIDERVT